MAEVRRFLLIAVRHSEATFVTSIELRARANKNRGNFVWSVFNGRANVDFYLSLIDRGVLSGYRFFCLLRFARL